LERVDALDTSLSRIGLGTWAMGGGGWFASIGVQDEAASMDVVRAAATSGVNWLDTARVYGLGRSEEIVGLTLRQLPERERPLVFTKCGVAWDSSGDPYYDLTPAGIRRDCDVSLRALGVERLDLLQIHWPAEDDTPFEDTWGTMADLVTEGKARWVGVSNFSVELLDQAESIRHIDAVQPSLSLLRHAALDDVIPWCARRGTFVLAYSSLESGLLAGTYSPRRVQELDDEDVRRTRSFFTAEGFPAASRFLERLRRIAAWRGCSVAEVAVGWVLSRPGVAATILGARSADQVREWSTWTDLKWDTETERRIEAALDEYSREDAV
jgi:aryl-alcohol dehydrogenase-like predicted oxidoreductase